MRGCLARRGRSRAQPVLRAREITNCSYPWTLFLPWSTSCRRAIPQADCSPGRRFWLAHICNQQPLHRTLPRSIWRWQAQPPDCESHGGSVPDFAWIPDYVLRRRDWNEDHSSDAPGRCEGSDRTQGMAERKRARRRANSECNGKEMRRCFPNLRLDGNRAVVAALNMSETPRKVTVALQGNGFASLKALLGSEN